MEGVQKMLQEESSMNESKNLVLGTEANDGREIEETGTHKISYTKHFIYPRLFVINPDGGGYELLTKEQLDYYFRL